MKASSLDLIDKQRDIYLQAWLTTLAKSSNKGKAVYKKFEDFYDYEKNVKSVMGDEEEKDISHLYKIANNLKERRKEE